MKSAHQDPTWPIVWKQENSPNILHYLHNVHSLHSFFAKDRIELYTVDWKLIARNDEMKVRL